MKKLAVVLFNLVLCALLVEGFSAIALQRVLGEWNTPGGYVEGLGTTSSTDDEPADAVGESPADALGAKQDAPRWMIQPYFGYARNPEVRVTHFNGTRIHAPVNEHGLFGPDPVTAEDEDRFIVALTGGSVALELYLHSRDALVEELQRLPAASGRRVEIVCLALGGMKQPQQVLQLNYFLALGAHYDLVINLDGFNEIALPMAENVARGVNPFFPRNWVAYSATSVDLETATIYGRLADLGVEKEARTGAFLDGLSRRTFTGSLLHALASRRLDAESLALELRLRELMSEETLAPQQRGPSFPSGKRKHALPLLVSMWQNGSRQMSSLAAGLGIPYFHFLQPNQYVAGSKPLSEWELQYAINDQADYAKSAIPGYPMLIAAGRELADEGIPYFDLTRIYADITEPIYKDNCCHVNEAGGRIMARAIGRAVVDAAG